MGVGWGVIWFCQASGRSVTTLRLFACVDIPNMRRQVEVEPRFVLLEALRETIDKPVVSKQGGPTIDPSTAGL